MKKGAAGSLSIDTGKKLIELDLLEGALSKSYSLIDFRSLKVDDIDGFRLLVDTENIEQDVMKELEEITSNLNKKFNVVLSLYGEIKTGIATIAENLSLPGTSIELEIHSI